MDIGSWALVAAAGLAAWLGASWSRGLPHYEAQRRAVPGRAWVAILLAALTAGIAVPQGDDLLSQSFLALWGVLFVLIAIIDIETHYIPDELILPATALALLASLVDSRLGPLSAILGAALGYGVFYIIVKVARGGFGEGDAKLSAFIGAVTGLLAVLYALVVGIFAGGLVALLLLLTRRVERRSYIPYGPFLCLGGWVAMLPEVVRLWGL